MNGIDIIIAIVNPRLRPKLVEMLEAQELATTAAVDLVDLQGRLAERSSKEGPTRSVLVMEEAFIYPHVYDECVHIKAASRLPLTIVLLVEPRTRTRADWNGADHIFRLPMQAREIVTRTLDVLGAEL